MPKLPKIIKTKIIKTKIIKTKIVKTKIVKTEKPLTTEDTKEHKRLLEDVESEVEIII